MAQFDPNADMTDEQKLAAQQASVSAVPDASPVSPIASEVNNSDELQNETADLAQANQTAAASPMPTVGPANATPGSSRDAFNPEEILNLYRSLKPAQEKERQDLSNVGIQTGANQIAQGIARGYGADIGAGDAGIKALQDQAKIPVANIKQQIDTAKEAMSTAKGAFDYQETQKMADPQSDISKFYQEQAKAALKKINPDSDINFDGISANQMMKNPMIKSLFSQQPKTQGFGLFVDAKTNHPLVSRSVGGNVEVIDAITGKLVDSNTQVSTPRSKIDPTTGNLGYFGGLDAGMLTPGQNQPKTQKLGEALKAGEIPPAAEPTNISETDLNKLNPKIYKESFLKTREDLMHDKDIERARTVNSNVTNILTKLSSLDPNNPKVDAGIKEALAAQAASVSVGGGRLAEGVIKEFGGAGGLMAKMHRYIDEKGPGYMSPEDMDFFKNFALKMQKAVSQDAIDKSQIYVDRIKAAPFGTPIDDSNARKLLNLGSLMQNTTVDKYNQMKAQKSAPAGMVTIKGPSGQTVQMDSEKAKKYLSKLGYELVQ